MTWSKPFFESKIQQEPNPGVDEEVLGRTEKEVKEGKASGPYTAQEVDAILGKLWALARRVGLKQFHGAVKGDERVSVAMRNGQVYEGRFHASVKEQAARKINWRTVDLRRAFKQLAPAPSMAPLGRDRPLAPQAWRGQVPHAQGASFRREERGLHLRADRQSLGAHPDQVVLRGHPQYVDGRDIMVEVLEMLGWQIKNEKGEAPEFAEEFTLLGLPMDVGSFEVALCGCPTSWRKDIESGRRCAPLRLRPRGGRSTLHVLSASGGARQHRSSS